MSVRRGGGFKVQSRYMEGNIYLTPWRDHVAACPVGCLAVGMDKHAAWDRMRRFRRAERGKCSNFEYRVIRG